MFKWSTCGLPGPFFLVFLRRARRTTRGARRAQTPARGSVLPQFYSVAILLLDARKRPARARRKRHFSGRGRTRADARAPARPIIQNFISSCENFVIFYQTRADARAPARPVLWSTHGCQHSHRPLETWNPSNAQNAQPLEMRQMHKMHSLSKCVKCTKCTAS